MSAPAGVLINGVEFAIADPSGSAPFFADFDLNGMETSELSITLRRNNLWVFASEFQFTATAVPEPSALAFRTLCSAVLGVGSFRRWRSRG